MIVVHRISWCMMGVWWHWSIKFSYCILSCLVLGILFSCTSPRLDLFLHLPRNVLPVVVLCLTVTGRGSSLSDMSAFYPADLKECATINKKKSHHCWVSCDCTKILAFTFSLYLWSPCHVPYMQWIQCCFVRRMFVKNIFRPVVPILFNLACCFVMMYYIVSVFYTMLPTIMFCSLSASLNSI